MEFKKLTTPPYNPCLPAPVYVGDFKVLYYPRSWVVPKIGRAHV